MRKILGIFAAFLFTGLPTGAPAQAKSGAAPADEYFGAHHESILGVRNRLDRLDARADQDMFAPTTMMELDSLQDAILDWQRQYPSDPWLPHTFARLLGNYQRAGGGTTSRAMDAWNAMQRAYPNSDETARVVAMGYGDGYVPVVSEPVRANAPMPASNAWVRFDNMRSNAPQPQSTEPPR